MLLGLPQSLPTESRWSTARTRADVTALLRALRSHLADLPKAAATDLCHPLTGNRYPQAGVRRGARGPSQTLQADLDRAIAAPTENLITLRIQAALVGFFLGWPAPAILSTFPTLNLTTYIWYVLRGDPRLPGDYVYIVYYDDDKLPDIRAWLRKRPRD